MGGSSVACEGLAFLVTLLLDCWVTSRGAESASASLRLLEGQRSSVSTSAAQWLHCQGRGAGVGVLLTMV